MKTSRGEENTHGCHAWLLGEVMQLTIVCFSCVPNSIPEEDHSLEVVEGIGLINSCSLRKEQVLLALKPLLGEELT